MSVNERQLMVKNLPPGFTQNRLKILFQNQRNQGGGPVANIELFEDTHSAIITFEDKTAVQTILGRGNHVDIKDTRCDVYPVVAPKPGSQAAASAVNAKVNYNLPTPHIPKPQPRLSLSAEHDQSSGKRQFKAQENPGVGAKDSSPFKGKTIQMQIYDPGTHRDEYTFFLEDDSVNKGTFAKDYVYMDGLKQVVYVPFDHPEDARKMCDHKCDEPNIYKIQMAEDGVFDHYANILSIHGADFSIVGVPRLKTIIRERTNKAPARVLMGEEPCSAMLIFADVRCITELYTMAWECTGVLDNNLLVAAPVRMCSMVLATVQGIVAKNTIERFFKKLGTLVSMDPRDDHTSYLVTFGNANDAKSVSDTKEHTVGGAKITTQLWHHCLSKKAYEDFVNLPRADATGNAPTANVQQPDNVATKGKSTPTTFEETDTLILKLREYILLQRSDFISKLVKLQDIIVEPEEDTHSITLKGSKEKVKSTKLKVKEELMNFEEERFGAFDDEVSDFLCQPPVVKIINDVLGKKEEVAYVYEKDGKLYCYKDSSLKLKTIQRLVERSLVVEREKLGEKMRALTSDKGRQFISDLHEKAKAPCKIHIDKGTEELVITVYEEDPSEKQGIASIKYDLDAFVKKNQIVTTRVPFPGLHQEYASQFLDLRGKVMVRLQATGVEMELESGSIAVSGLEAAVNAAEQEVRDLGKITVQEEVIQCFGIQEYLQSEHGQYILDNIGTKNRCLLKLGADPAVVADGSSLGAGPSQRSPRTAPAPALKGKLIGSCSEDGVKVKFIMGDITSLAVDVIVNVVDFKRQCRKGMNKAIIDNGGDVIQQELNSYRGGTQTGTIIPTQGGKMHCSSVYHLILKKDGEANDLLAFTTDILKKAEQDGHKSLAMPLLGCGRFRLQKVGVSLNVAKAVRRHAGQASSLKEIIVCDYDPINLKSIMERFDNIDQVMSLDSVSRHDSDDGSGDSDASRSPRQDKKDKDASGGKSPVTFGTINFTIKQGDIVQESCDAIVCGIKDTMELKSGGAVSKAMFKMCGGALQTECSQKVDELSQEGAVVTSSNGLSCKSIIFVSMSKYSRNWYKGVERVLALAEEKGFASVALPALGTGSKHADMPKLKSSILSAVKKFGKGKPSKVKDIRLVIFDKRTRHIFQDDGVSDKRSQKKDSYLPVPIVSKKASVQVVYQNAANGNKAVKELRQECSNKYSKNSFTNDETKKLLDKEVKKLEVAGLRKQVLVNIQRGSSTYTLSGFDVKSIMQVQDEICRTLLALKDKEHQQDFRSFKTAFKWQFMSRDRWRDFEPEINIEIEKAFKKSEDSVQFSDPTGRKYRIDFKTMKEFRVRQNGEEEITTINRYDLQAAVANVPTTWDKMASGENVKIVQLSNSSKEYTDVETYFKNCGANVPIKKIERIQNVVLYQQYSSKKTYFDKTNPKGTENEKKLFHGTDPAAMANINESGFNRSFCGKNATMYGEGVYFAEQSSYSVGYARADANGNKSLYLARVLVGLSTPSTSGTKFLPNKPGTNVPFDSGRGPKMFIIFHDCQAYPEYLITF